jgi:hypothetical protein
MKTIKLQMVMEAKPYMLETSSWYHGPLGRPPFITSEEVLTNCPGSLLCPFISLKQSGGANTPFPDRSQGYF